MRSKFLVVINPTANGGKAKQIGEQVISTLKSRNIPFEHRASKYAGNTEQITEQLVKNSFNQSTYHFVIVVIGGDGTVNEVISSINNTTNDDHPLIPVGIIPAGKNNNFATVQKIPLKWEDALNQIINCKSAKNLSIGHFYDNNSHNDSYFLNNLEIGIGSDLLNEAQNTSSRFKFIKFFKRIISIFSTLYNLDTFNLYLRIHNHYENFSDTADLIIQNNPLWDNNRKLINQENIPSDKLRILILEKKNFFLMLVHIYYLLRGKKIKTKSFHNFYVSELSINDSVLKYGNIDGNVIGSKFFDINCNIIKFPFWI